MDKESRAAPIRIRGLRKRWLLNTLLPVLLAVVMVVGVFAVGISDYYYNGMRSDMESKASNGAEVFNTIAMTSYNAYYQMASAYVEEFEEKDWLELQFITSSGRVLVSSYSRLTAGLRVDTADVSAALGQGETGAYKGRDPITGQTILSVCAPLTFEGRVVGAIRYVSATNNVDRKILFNVLAVTGIALLCLLLVYFTSIVFINSVVEPVAEVTQTAKRISGGSYGIQLENHYSDELAELVDAVNDMSEKIKQAEQIKNEFISSVSHELRTPLTAINGWGETLLAEVDSGGDPEQLRRGLGILLKENRRLTGMVEELLDFSKMEDGRFILHVEQVDLQAEFEDAVYTYRELFRQERIELRYDDGGTILPPVSGDPERLKQVFCNVLDNAAKHGGAGGRIEAAVSVQGDQAVLTVRDHGPGIPAEELPFVKQKFYKGSSKARGSGIGLAVCEEIVQLHNGSFHIANAEGGGAIVTICLPLR